MTDTPVITLTLPDPAVYTADERNAMRLGAAMAYRQDHPDAGLLGVDIIVENESVIAD